MYFVGLTIVALLHMACDNLTYQFMGAGIQHEQMVFAEKIRKRSVPFETALREHREFNTKNRRVVSLVSLELNIFIMLGCITAFGFAYEYFVMPHSHWGHIANYAFLVVMTSFILPFSWGPVNDNQDALRLLVAESVGGITMTVKGDSKQQEEEEEEE